MLQARLGVGALLGAQHDDAVPAKPANSADHGRVLGEGAVAGERHELVDQPGNVVEAMRPLGMPRDLHLLPGRQLRVALADEPLHLRFEPPDLLGDVEPAVVRQAAQLVDLALELRDRPLEIEKMPHQRFRVRERMRGLDQPAQPLALDMGIDLRRRDVGVAEHLLHAAQIGAAVEQMAGEGMAQHVRRQPRRVEPGFQRQLLEQLAAALPRQVALAAARREQPALGLRAARVGPRDEAGAAFEIFGQGAPRRLA